MKDRLIFKSIDLALQIICFVVPAVIMFNSDGIGKLAAVVFLYPVAGCYYIISSIMNRMLLSRQFIGPVRFACEIAFAFLLLATITVVFVYYTGNGYSYLVGIWLEKYAYAVFFGLPFFAIVSIFTSIGECVNIRRAIHDNP